MATETPSLNEFRFISQEPEGNIVVTPTFLRGKLASHIYPMHQQAKARLNDNPNLKLKYDGSQITESTIFDVAVIDELVRQHGVRTAMPYDIWGNQAFMKAIKGNHYVDFRALALRTVNDSLNPKNNSLARRLAEHVDLAKGPALITGFKLDSFEGDCGLQFTPTDEFNAFYDDRLAGRWTGYKFDEVDEHSLPLHLDEKKGKHTWYTRDDGLSGLGLDRYLGLDSYWNGLDNSYSNGRVVLVGGEATTQNL